MESIQGAWKFLISIGAGAGLVFMLRWFWWRVNAWSEIAAMSASAAVSLFLQSRWASRVVEVFRRFDPALPSGPLDGADPHGFAWLMIVTTAATTLTWLVATFATSPEPREKLVEFYLKVQPSSFGWQPIAQATGTQSAQKLKVGLVHWLLGCVMLYSALFGVGNIVFHRYGSGLLLLVVAAASISAIFWDLKRRDWESLR
jgi:solute:Na+ symporter, SSS family